MQRALRHACDELGHQRGRREINCFVVVIDTYLQNLQSPGLARQTQQVRQVLASDRIRLEIQIFYRLVCQQRVHERRYARLSGLGLMCSQEGQHRGEPCGDIRNAGVTEDLFCRDVVAHTITIETKPLDFRLGVAENAREHACAVRAEAHAAEIERGYARELRKQGRERFGQTHAVQEARPFGPASNIIYAPRLQLGAEEL